MVALGHSVGKKQVGSAFGSAGSTVFLTVVCCVGVGACATLPAESAVSACPTQTLVMASTRDFMAAPQGRSLIFETMVDFDSAGRAIPKLARSWQIDPDERVYTFALRTDVRFHDGRPFTAETAAFSLRVAARTAGFGRHLDNVEALDSHTVRIRLRQPYWPLLSELALEANAKMIAPTSMTPVGAVEGEMTRNIGTGPFRVVSYQKNGNSQLARNEQYWDRVATLERLLWRTMPDPHMQVDALRDGRVDVIGAAEHHGALPYPAFARLAQDPRFKVAYRSYGRHQVIDFNVTRPMLSDVRVRRAVNAAIDRGRLVSSLFNGIPKSANALSPGAPAWPQGPDASAEPIYDPSSADALLNSAGWVRLDQEGLRHRGDLKLALRLLVNRGESNGLVAATFVRDELRRIGIDVQIDALPSSEIVARLRSGDFDMHMSHSCSIAQLGCLGAAGKYTSGNDTAGLYSTAELDRLMSSALGVTGEPQRRLALDRVWNLLREQAVGAPLYEVIKPIAHARHVAGVDFGPTVLTIDLQNASVSPSKAPVMGCAIDVPEEIQP